MNLLWMLYTFAPAVLAGFVQTVTGFGGGIVVMLFFSLFLPVTAATSLNTLIMVWINLVLCWKYRKKTDWKLLLPCGLYLVVSAAAIWLSGFLDMGMLKAWLGLFFVAVAIYFLFFSHKIRLKICWQTTLLCVTLAGILDGLFGIGGPPMVLYFMAAAGEDREKYFACIQTFFAMTGAYNVLVRSVTGAMTVQVCLLAIPGIAGLLLGKVLGAPVLRKVDGDAFKKVVYTFLAVAGIIIFATSL